MQNYIQMNLDKDISMTDLARVSMYSPWYSYRLFVQFFKYDTHGIYQAVTAIEISITTSE